MLFKKKKKRKRGTKGTNLNLTTCPVNAPSPHTHTHTLTRRGDKDKLLDREHKNNKWLQDCCFPGFVLKPSLALLLCWREVWEVQIIFFRGHVCTEALARFTTVQGFARMEGLVSVFVSEFVQMCVCAFVHRCLCVCLCASFLVFGAVFMEPSPGQ